MSNTESITRGKPDLSNDIKSIHGEDSSISHLPVDTVVKQSLDGDPRMVVWADANVFTMAHTGVTSRLSWNNWSYPAQMWKQTQTSQRGKSETTSCPAVQAQHQLTISDGENSNNVESCDICLIFIWRSTAKLGGGKGELYQDWNVIINNPTGSFLSCLTFTEHVHFNTLYETLSD